MQKKNFKTHTINVHGPNAQPKLKQIPGQQKISFGKREVEPEPERQEPGQSVKRVKTSEGDNLTDNISTTFNLTEDSSFVDAVKFVVEAHTKEIKKEVNIAKQEIKEEVRDIKTIIGSNTKHSNPKHSESNSDKEERDIDSIINSARNINEMCLLLTELQYHDEFEVVSCTLCVNQASLRTFKETFRETKTKIPGILTYKKTGVTSRNFATLKGNLKSHMTGQTHKESVNRLKEEEKRKYIDRNNASTNNDHDALMRCSRICHFLYQKGRPYTDYPEQVAMMVKGKVYMGNINHSTEFPSDYLEHLAAVVKEEIIQMFDEILPQTGFRRPVKIVADKDTAKHRTRQAVCLTTIIPEAEELIQTLYIDHPVSKHHTAKDTAENIHSAINPFIKSEQVEGGSYDGPYHHAKEDVPHHLNKIMGIANEDTQSDHDYLHRCGISEKNAKNYGRNYWVDNMSNMCSKINNEHNFGKAYEEALDLADDMNMKFEQPKFQSDTRFSNHASKVFNSFYHDLPVFIKHYEQIKETYKNSNVQREKDKAKHASDILKKISNKKFFYQVAGGVDIYKILSQLACELQIVNLLPHERYDRFERQLEKLREMISCIDDHSSCGDPCLWKKLHSDTNCISTGDLGSVILNSDEPEALVFTRSVYTQAQENQTSSTKEKTYNEIKHFAEDLLKEMSTVFRNKDKEMVELTRNLTDWKSLSINVKTKGAPVVFALENAKFVENALKVGRSLREIDSEELKNQFSTFLERLGKVIENKSMEELLRIDAKDLIKTFMRNSNQYKGIEMIMQATIIGAIKISVESVAESIISKYGIHNSKIRALKDTTANNEMFVAINGPEVGEADSLLAKALDRKFSGRLGWHISVKQNLFRTSGPTVENILKRKSKLNIYSDI